MPDDVPLTDLEVVQRWSVAVRAATAPREELVAALESDLAWLTGSAPRRRAPRARAATEEDESPAAPRRAARKAPAKRTAREA